jgi:nitrogen regulatory protein PII
MKLVFIVYGNAIDPDVSEALEELGLTSYTKWREVFGKGATSGPHLGDHVWPGVNSMLMIVLDDDQLAPLMKERFAHEGLKLYSLPVEQAL